MFLTTKKIKGGNYLYVMNSFRKKLAKRPTTQTIKYIGNVEDYSEEEISKIRELLKDKDANVWIYIDELKQLKLAIKKKELEIKKEKRKEELELKKEKRKEEKNLGVYGRFLKKRKE